MESNKIDSQFDNLSGAMLWERECFEAWLKTKKWDEETKDRHRGYFKGLIVFDDNTISYSYN